MDLKEWFEKLALNVLPVELYYEYSNEEVAYLILYRYSISPERRWGWSWGSWLSTIFDCDEFYMSLDFEDQKILDEKLFQYIETLAMKVSEEQQKKLQNKLKELIS